MQQAGHRSVRELALELCSALRERVLPELGSHAGREHVGEAKGGDVTFAIDEQAESLVEEFLGERAPEVAFYSEDRGMVCAHDDPQWVLLVDPIDGTRPAMAGFESACISVAAAPLEHEPRFGDAQVGCVCEIKSGATFVAERGAGVEPAARLSANADPSRMFWAYGLRGRPAIETMRVLAELIDSSSVGGGTFDLGSASYDITRIVSGQLDAYVEPGPRMVEDVPGMRERFEQVGGGAVLNNSPYDVAAAALCLTEAGGLISDAYGRSLDGRPLLGSGESYQISCIAAANRELHRAICEAVERGVERLAASAASGGPH